MKLLTIDTSSLIEWLNGQGEVDQIMKWHEQGLVEVRVSSRVANDVRKIHEKQHQALAQKLSAHGIQILPSAANPGIAPGNGSDVAEGQSVRSDTDLQRFEEFIGTTPAPLPRPHAGRQLRNKIEDYSPLRDHFATKRDIFITSATRGYFTQTHRWNYKARLGIVIQSPREFVDAFRQTL